MITAPNPVLSINNATEIAGSSPSIPLGEAALPATVHPRTGLLRLSKILAPRGPISVGKSTWWAGVKWADFPSR
jgi:hypothetical protein